jgi:deoxyribodipyrimidine photolyase-like uncharacterized protein
MFLTHFSHITKKNRLVFLPSDTDVRSLLQGFLPNKMSLTSVAGFSEQVVTWVKYILEIRSVLPRYNPVYRKWMNLSKRFPREHTMP